MPTSPRDTRTRESGPYDAATGPAHAPASVRARALATASDIFAAASDATAVPELAASALADRPGQMCLVSLTRRGTENLEPVAVAHVRPKLLKTLQAHMRRKRRTPPDAFSREVMRSGRAALQVPISTPRVLRLWLPDVYWPYAERLQVSAVLAAALRDRERVVGTLLLWRERGQPAFDAADQAYVVCLAERLAFGLRQHPTLT